MLVTSSRRLEIFTIYSIACTLTGSYFFLVRLFSDTAIERREKRLRQMVHVNYQSSSDNLCVKAESNCSETGVCNMSRYIFSKQLMTFANLAIERMVDGRGAVLFLHGIPGSGKTEFARAVADMLGAQFFKYQCVPDKERDILYEIDVDGVLNRTNGWKKKPAWLAFEASHDGYVVLLIDEVDKTHPNFDAFLLELLEEYRFMAPDGSYVQADPSKLMLILTSNGRRQLRTETLRRMQRIPVHFPDQKRLEGIIQQIVGDEWIPRRLMEQVIRFADQMRREDPEMAPAPKEMALFIVDAMNLAYSDNWDLEVWRDVFASYFTKDDSGAVAIDKILKFNWAKALVNDLQKSLEEGR